MMDLFPTNPPPPIRYQFSSPSVLAATGQWWQREVIPGSSPRVFTAHQHAWQGDVTWSRITHRTCLLGLCVLGVWSQLGVVRNALVGHLYGATSNDATKEPTSKFTSHGSSQLMAAGVGGFLAILHCHNFYWILVWDYARERGGLISVWVQSTLTKSAGLFEAPVLVVGITWTATVIVASASRVMRWATSRERRMDPKME